MLSEMAFKLEHTVVDLDRRRFLRVIGGASIASAVAPHYGMAVGMASRDGVLLEAAAFAEPGGWVLDTQFFQQMGGCYLLAHGMGVPVANARSRVQLPAGGTWHVFIRTHDWCPGDWESPGRFRVLIDGKPLAPTFGTQAGWGWQTGGGLELPAGEHTVELQDLTGFDGRCDAIYFSREPQPDLPNTPEAIFGWKDQLSGRSALSVALEDFDVVVVGGGMSGCGAALAAESQGLKVALIQDRPIFGGNASAEIRVHTLGIHGKGGAILKRIDTEHWPNGDAQAISDQAKREASLAASRVHLFPNHLAIGLELDGKRIKSVEARESRSGLIRRFRAPVFIDCTGDAWLGYRAGAEFRYGRESNQEFGEKWDKHGDLWSPDQADTRVMGASVLWNSYSADRPNSFPDVPWAAPVSNGHSATQGEWYWEYSRNDLDQIADAEQIRDHMLRAIYGSFAAAKKNPKNALTTLKWVAFVGGRRESRRIIGDYIFTMQDMVENRAVPDAVVEETREIDAHYQLAERGSPYSFLSKALFYKAHGLYLLPFRCFYSKDIPNLMMAGRCFSCSHIGLSGPRVMNTCGQMGIATGYAAALCKKYALDPRDVGQKHIDELRTLIGYT